MCYGDVYKLQYGDCKSLCVSYDKGLPFLKFARGLDLPSYTENGKVCINMKNVGDDCTGAEELAKLYESMSVLDNITSTKLTNEYAYYFPSRPFSTHYCAYTTEDAEIVLNMSEPLGLTPTSVKNSTQNITTEGLCVTMYYHCDTKWAFRDLTALFTRTGKQAVEMVASLSKTIDNLHKEIASLHSTQETLQGKLSEQSQANAQRTARFEKQNQEDNAKTGRRLDSLEQWKSESNTKQGSKISDLEGKLAACTKTGEEQASKFKFLESTVQGLQSQMASLSEGCKKVADVSHVTSAHTEHQSDNHGISSIHEQHNEGTIPVPPAGVAQDHANVLHG